MEISSPDGTGAEAFHPLQKLSKRIQALPTPEEVAGSVEENAAF